VAVHVYLCNAAPVHTQQCFLEGSQVSPVRPSDKSGVEMWNYTDKGNRSNWGKNQSHYQRRNVGGEEPEGQMPHPQNVFYVRTVFYDC